MDQTIINTDCLDALTEMDDNSVHAVVTDPPYGLAFMGRSWDQFEPKEYQEWCEEWASEALRVLKPGGHLIAFSGNRTHHRLFTAVEDVGFTVRDTITWHHGEGFPKGSDISKHIDRYYDAEDEREVVGEYTGFDTGDRDTDRWESDKLEGTYNGGDTRKHHHDESGSGCGSQITAPATSEAEQWDGWRTSLKPSTEFAVLARAPMSEDAVYKNVLEHGTGALNADRTRIPTIGDESLDGGGAKSRAKNQHEGYMRPYHDDEEYINTRAEFEEKKIEYAKENGRYPANLLLDGVASRMLDEQSGTSVSSGGSHSVGYGSPTLYGDGDDTRFSIDPGYGDEGGASRFFYTSKASSAERSCNGEVQNEHPTVKPLDLMEWLVTLVTAPGQRVVDPFAGSGTTIMACKRLGREGIGIEQDDEHAELARKRVAHAHEIETDFDAPESESEDSTMSGEPDAPPTLDSFVDD